MSQGWARRVGRSVARAARLLAKKVLRQPVRTASERQKTPARPPKPAPNRTTPHQNTKQIRTVGEVREALGLDESALQGIKDTDAFTWINNSPKGTSPGTLLFLPRPRQQKVEEALRRGATMFVASRLLLDGDGKPLPTLIHSQPGEAYIETLAHVRSRHDLQVIAITGSIGKTTVKEMVRLVCQTHFRTLASERNANVLRYIGIYVQRLRPSTQVYIQETGVTRPGFVEKGSRVLQPTAFVITNLGFDHLGDFGGDRQALLSDKLSHERHLPEDGVAFVNLDDPTLKSISLDHRIIWYSEANTEADYYATNVREDNGRILFNIVDRAEESSTPVILNTFGVHNVSNAVAAYAVGRWLRVPPSKIARGLAVYSGKGTRQNLAQMGSQRVLVDCFNASEAATLSTAKSLDAMNVENGGRRILVLADLDDKMGEVTEETHRRTGATLAAKSNADLIALFGKHAGWIAEEARAAGKNVFHTLDRAEFHSYLDREIQPTDVLAFKGGQQMAMSLTVDWLFGTDFVLDDGDELEERSVVVDRPEGRYRLVEEYGAVFARMTGKDAATSITVEPAVEGQPTLMVGRYACAQSQLIKAEIPPPVISLAKGAFYRSESLVEVTLPETLKMIGTGAFRGCSALETVNIPDGVSTINNFAFRSCSSLRTLTLPKSVAALGKGVFMGCKNLEVRLPKGSQLAAKYPEVFADVTVTYYA